MQWFLFFILFNNIIHTKRSSTNLPFKLTLDGNEKDEPGKISECFNEYFVQIRELIAKKAKLVNETNFKTFLNNSITQSIVLDPFQPIEIYNIINSININKACGYDNISSFFLRMGGEILAPILSLCFSRAFDLGIFPSIFKIAIAVPIFKSGNKQIVKNYRPISLLLTLSKILEKLIKTRLIKFFDKYQVLYEFQYGFGEKHSVLHALLDVNVFALDAIQSKQHTALLLMDVRKAFDTVSHNILLQQLYYYGIRGTAYKLLESYLLFRNQFVSV